MTKNIPMDEVTDPSLLSGGEVLRLSGQSRLNPPVIRPLIIFRRERVDPTMTQRTNEVRFHDRVGFTEFAEVTSHNISLFITYGALFVASTAFDLLLGNISKMHQTMPTEPITIEIYYLHLVIGCL